MHSDEILPQNNIRSLGSSNTAIAAVKLCKKTGADTALIYKGSLENSSELEALGINVISDMELSKKILYPEGRVAGIMGKRVSDGRKLIVNGDAFALDDQSTAEYMPLICSFGAAFEGGSPVTGENGLVVCVKDISVSGIYIMGDSKSGMAAGEYALDVDRRIYSRFREHPMMQGAPKIPGEYKLTIVGMPDVPKHTVIVKEETGVLSGTHETENDLQVMQDVHMENG